VAEKIISSQGESHYLAAERDVRDACCCSAVDLYKLLTERSEEGLLETDDAILRQADRPAGVDDEHRSLFCPCRKPVYHAGASRCLAGTAVVEQSYVRTISGAGKVL